LLALVGVTSAQECQLDSTDAVASAIDSALYIWASTKRCSPPIADAVACERDITSSIEAVTAAAGAIAEIVGSCGGIKDANAQCALAVNGLVSATAGLASAGGQVADFCVKQNYVPPAEDRATTLGKCTISGGGAINSLFHAQQTIHALSKRCVPSEKKCVVGLLDAVTVVSSLGAHLAGAAAFCQEAHDKTVHGKAQCAGGIMASLAHLTYVARMGMGIEKACSPEATRLYLEGKDLADKGEGSFASLGLFVAAAFPITAVLSVVAGLRLAKSRQQASQRDVEQDAEQLLALEE